MKQILIIFSLIFTSTLYAEVKTLDTETETQIHSLITSVLDTQTKFRQPDKYKSKNVQQRLLSLLPDKIVEDLYYGTKEEYIKRRIGWGDKYKDVFVKELSYIKDISCHYLEDNSIDCRVEYIETYLEHHQNETPERCKPYSQNEYLFNMKMDSHSEFFINKMVLYSIIRSPNLNTLQVDEKINKRMLESKNAPKKISYKPKLKRPLTKEERFLRKDFLEEERQEVEAKQKVFDEVQKTILENMHEQMNEFEKESNNINKIYDMNGNRISQILRNASSTRTYCHPIYGCRYHPRRGELYVRHYAVNYALTYAYNYNNSRYRSFFNDCANFVSQALVEGGWQNDWGPDYRSSRNWFYYPWYQSYTWQEQIT